MKRRLLLGISVLLIFALFLAGCGSSTQATSTQAAAQTQSTLEKVLKTKQLTVACVLSFAPFGMKDEKGNPQGYDVDLANELAKSLGAKLTIIDVNSANRIPYLETGKADVVIGDFTRTLERAQKIDFTDPYVVAGETLLVKKGSGIKSINDLHGKTVAVVKGGTGSIAIKAQVTDSTIQNFDTAADCVTAVKNGQADAFAEDSNLVTYMAKINPELEEVGDSIVPLEYNGLGLRKNDQEWLNYLNLFIFEMNRTGKNQELYQKWFGKKLPFSLNPAF